MPHKSQFLRTLKGERRLMDIDWVRDVDRQCKAAKIAHYFKQRYVDDRGNPVEDGWLDGKVRQAWPLSSRLVRSNRPGVFRVGE